MTQQIFANNAAIDKKLETMKMKQESELKRRQFKERQSKVTGLLKNNNAKENSASAKELSNERPISGEVDLGGK